MTTSLGCSEVRRTWPRVADELVLVSSVLALLGWLTMEVAQAWSATMP